MAVPYRSPLKVLVLIFTIQFLVFINNARAESSGDGEFKPFNVDDEEEVFGGSETIQPEDPEWRFDENDDDKRSGVSSSSTSTTTTTETSVDVIDIDEIAHHNHGETSNNETDVVNTTAISNDEDVDSAMG